ncbi:MAG: fibronectin type III domain-containing protein, partial [Treponema sp.]|nr:fibronectin type III domain-containing protein [Treponema sp.]
MKTVGMRGKPGAILLAVLLAAALLCGCPGTGTDPVESYRAITIQRDESVLTLSWEAAPEAEGYRLYTSENREDTEDIQPLELEDPVYIMTWTNSGSVYYFRVKAIVGGVEGEDWWARGKAAMPVSAPSGVVLSRTYTSLYVFWDPVNGAASYEVYYSRFNNSGGAGKWTGAIEGTSTEIQDLKNNVSYYVWVRAVGPEGPSPFSGVKNAMTGEPKKPAVPVIAWTIRMKNAVGAIWRPAENAVEYEFCYGTGTDPASGKIITVKDTVCLAEGLPANVNYRMWVRGKNIQYVSDWTQVYEAKTEGFPERMEGTYFSRWP